MREIELTQGQVALVDNDTFEYLNKFKWLADKIGRTWYAKRYEYNEGKRKTIYMHRYIISLKQELSKEILVDHKDGDALNNLSENLRVCNKQQNQHNQKSHINSTSKYKGVSFDKSRNKWRVNICFNYKVKGVGRFETEIEAAQAYNMVAKELHGEFANINIICL